MAEDFDLNFRDWKYKYSEYSSSHTYYEKGELKIWCSWHVFDDNSYWLTSIPTEDMDPEFEKSIKRTLAREAMVAKQKKLDALMNQVKKDLQ